VGILAILVALWLGAGAIPVVRATETANSGALLAVLAFPLLALAVAGLRTALSGWVLAGFGSAYVLLHWLVLWRNYSSTGVEFPGAARWTQIEPKFAFVRTPAIRPEKAVVPDEWPDRLRVLLDPDALAPTPEAPGGFLWAGLAGNPNATGTIIALFLAFLVPFLAHRWKPWWHSHRVLVLTGRIVLLALIVPPGLAMLWALEARTALGAVLLTFVALLLPLRWARSRIWSAAFAGGVLVAITVPVLITLGLGRDFAARACTWESWLTAMESRWLWGVGSLGVFPNTASCDISATNWGHAHNELLQAWSKGGLIGLVSALTLLGGLSYWAFRHRGRDDRALLALMTFSAVLMGLEVLNTAQVGVVSIGMTVWVSVAARSVQMMSAARPDPSPTSAPPED
jgi:hypothetical protein